MDLSHPHEKAEVEMMARSGFRLGECDLPGRRCCRRNISETEDPKLELCMSGLGQGALDSKKGINTTYSPLHMLFLDLSQKRDIFLVAGKAMDIVHIASVPLFQALPEEHHKDLTPVVADQVFRRGDLIFINYLRRRL